MLELETGIRMHLAHTRRARLLGLALMRDLDPDDALVIPHCTSVHTFGMRFPIDVVFVDRDWLPIYVEYGVGPWLRRGSSSAPHSAQPAAKALTRSPQLGHTWGDRMRRP